MKKWLSHIEPTILSMAGLRMVSGLLEFSAAIVMLLLNDVKKALAINALLATLGPIIFLLTMTLGLLYMADDLSFHKIFFIASGVGLILIGLYR